MELLKKASFGQPNSVGLCELLQLTRSRQRAKMNQKHPRQKLAFLRRKGCAVHTRHCCSKVNVYLDRISQSKRSGQIFCKICLVRKQNLKTARKSRCIGNNGHDLYHTSLNLRPCCFADANSWVARCCQQNGCSNSRAVRIALRLRYFSKAWSMHMYGF